MRMFSMIRKRNGHIVSFDKHKIAKAIARSGQATGEFSDEIADVLTLRVLNLAQQVIQTEIPEVETIQDIVEEVLLASPYKKTAKAYIIYRDQHSRIRELVSTAGVKLIDQYLEKLDWQVNENSNMAYSLQGLNNYIASEVSKTYWLSKIYPPEIREAHMGGDMHIHDLGQLSVYCVGWDLMDVLLTGFCGAEGKVESSPAKHFRSAVGADRKLLLYFARGSSGSAGFFQF